MTVSDSAWPVQTSKVPPLAPELGATPRRVRRAPVSIPGLCSRARSALLGMTAVIQIRLPDAWPTHLVWATALPTSPVAVPARLARLPLGPDETAARRPAVR
jgi:hypothetical protein